MSRKPLTATQVLHITAAEADELEQLGVLEQGRWRWRGRSAAEIVALGLQPFTLFELRQAAPSFAH